MSRRAERDRSADVAIVGLAGRFPGAGTLDAFWRNLRQGVESVTRFSRQELEKEGAAAALLGHPAYVPARAVLQGIELFDAEFFGYSPREAEILDPQQRLFLECAWQALEDAGCDPQRFDGPIGVYAATGANTYLLYHLLSRRKELEAVGEYQVMLGSDSSFLATRVSYELGLRGPGMTVQTACSSSLVAVHLAVQSLLNGECDLALAGGVRVTVPQKSGYLYEEGGILSPDGRCRAFDASAAGCVDGNGAGVAALKRLEDALEDGDTVRAVILGSAVNNDGSHKVGFTAPSVDGQAEVIAMCHALARVAPDSISAIEAHGTGTVMGDPIEVAALKQAFGNDVQGRGFCALGSVKTNVGHLDSAAGIAGLIKTVLALQHSQLPPSLHFEKENPALQLQDSPFYVNDRLQPWKSPQGVPRRAGVSSFGIGGTNAHLVLEEAPAAEPPAPCRPWQLLPLSARSGAALESARENLARHLEEHPETDLADAAYTLQAGRQAFEHRSMLVCRDLQDAIETLRSLDPLRVLNRVQESVQRPVVFAFPGQGAQYPGMCRELYDQEPTFRQRVDECLGLLDGQLGTVLGSSRAAGDTKGLLDTRIAQPALFVIEYALARLWMDWGIRPAGMIGHSVGEYVAACLGGTLSLEDALHLVAERGRLMQEMPAGGMLAVDLGEGELRPLLGENTSLAAVNAPRLCVASGPAEEIGELQGLLEKRGVGCRRLHTSHAFHSSMMDPVLEGFEKAVRSVKLQEPELPWVSNLSGALIRPEEAVDPAYWVRQLRQTVRFSQGLAEALQDQQAVLLEVGPGNTLVSLARRHPAGQGNRVMLASSRHPKKSVSDQSFLLHTLGQLWLAGVEVDWQGFRQGMKRRRVPLPTYPFQRRRYWLEARPGAWGAPPAAGEAVKKEDVADWFYLPVWKQSFPSFEEEPRGRPGRWLLLGDDSPRVKGLAEAMGRLGAEVVRARAGQSFADENGAFTVGWGSPEGFEKLLQEAGPLQGIVHLWGLAPPQADWDLDEAEQRCFYSLLHLAQALGKTAFQPPLRLVLAANGLFAIQPGDPVDPLKALLLGPARVIPLEFPGISCLTLDLGLPQEGTEASRAFSRWAEEILSERGQSLAAFRGKFRWVQAFEALRVPPAPQEALRLRPQGVYLITGGFGGLGYSMALELAQSVQARLVLLGRSAVEGKARQIAQLEEAGAEVLALCADAADGGQVAEAVEKAQKRFGALHGVIHAAGVAGGGAIQLKERAQAAAVLAPKVRGTLALASALRGEELDFFLLFSSLSSLTGAPGQVDYTAANAFQDAFAQAAAAAADSLSALPPAGSAGILPTISVSWDAWQRVGMAARAAGLEEPPVEPESVPAGHPLLDRCLTEDGVRCTYLSRLDTSRHWILSEHRLGGRPVVPGTAYLEMARAAFEGFAGQGQMELRDVLFTGPLQVQDNHACQVRTVLESRQGSQWRFSVESRPADGGQAAPWQGHAGGTILPLESPPPQRSLGDLMRECSERQEEMGEDYRESLHSAGLGPRWHVLQKVSVGENQLLGQLHLDEGYAADLAEFKLHPSLLDTATGFAEHYLDVRQDSYYLPLSYSRLRLFAPLTTDFFSHVRFRDDAPGRETYTYDLELLDGQGSVLAQIEGFTVKRVSDVAAAVRRSVQPDEAVQAGDAGTDLSDGILPEEGLEVFRRLLRPSMPPHVLISTRGLQAVLQEVRQAASASSPSEDAETLHERPQLDTPYTAPRNQAEERVAGIWQSVLGISQVGVYDDFFALGGHSLLATQVVSRLRDAFQVEIPLDSLFQASTVAEFAVLLGQGGEGPVEGAHPIPPADREGDLPLSYAQQRLWFLDQFQPGNPAYNMHEAIRLRGALQADILQAGLREVVRRHEALRTRFPAAEGKPVQVIRRQADLSLPLIDLSALPEAPAARELLRLRRQDALLPFSLAQGPLLRTRLVRLQQAEHVLMVNMHHIVSDGWTLQVLMGELAAFYQARRSGQPAGLAELPVQYADFAAWQRSRMGADYLREHLDYWRQTLQGAPALLELPADRPRSSQPSRRGANLFFRWPAKLCRALRDEAQRREATEFMALIAASMTLMARWSGQDDISLGTPIANRTRTETEKLIGFFVNMLVLRSRLPEGTGLGGLIESVRQAAAGAYAHQEVPFEQVVDALQPRRSASYAPLFQVTFTLQNISLQPIQLAGLEMTRMDPVALATQFDLMLVVEEEGEGLLGEAIYSTDLFDASTVRRVLGQWQTLLQNALADPGANLWELPLLSPAQRHQVLDEWASDTARPYPRRSGISPQFRAQAARRPQAVAAAFCGQQLSYAELGRRSRLLARHLESLGVGADLPVGLCMERSLELVVGLLGILQAGGAYLPLDPSYPLERTSWMLEDSGAPVVLTQESFSGRLPSTAWAVNLDQEWGLIGMQADESEIPPVDAGQLAYIIYTSGSTGRPKGVAATQQAVLRLVKGTDYVRLGPQETHLLLAPISFDASTFEVWGSLLNGGRLAIFAPQAPTLEQLGRTLERESVTTLWLTAPLFHLMADQNPEPLGGLRRLLAGGDVLSLPQVERALQSGAGCVINGYGPTENTTFSCCFPMRRLERAWHSAPIGPPIANSSAYVLDRHLNPVPEGVFGELCLGGDGLARGYLNRPALTAERFVPHPFAAGGRLYRSGDRVRWLCEGILEFQGRLDRQVKLRGFRVEPGEVEAALLKIEGVRQAAVVAWNQQLVGYVVGEEEGENRRGRGEGTQRDAEESSLRPLRLPSAPSAVNSLLSRLEVQLPRYMVPSQLIFLDRLPLSPSGKLDRKALPDPGSMPASSEEKVEPQTPTEHGLAAIWSEVLEVEGIGSQDDFFELGGHSLLATQVVSRIRQAMGIELPLQALFDAPRLDGQARQIDEALLQSGRSAELPLTRRSGGELPLSFAQQRLWFLHQLEPHSPFYNIPAALSLEGDMRVEVLQGVLSEIVRRHEALRTVFDEEEGRPRQVVQPPGAFGLPLIDLTSLKSALRGPETSRLAARLGSAPFDLRRGPLLRAYLVRQTPARHLLAACMHHIVSDGWSIGVLTDELMALYPALEQGRPSPLEQLPVQYSDFARWQRERMAGDFLQEQVDYWKGRLQGTSAPELPADRPRLSRPTFRGGSRQFSLSAELAQSLNRLSRQADATLFMTLLTGFQILLARYCGTKGVNVGTPVANRNRAETEGLIGFFVNTLVLRSDFSGARSFLDALGRVRQEALGAYAHQDLPFEHLVELLQPERSLSRMPLFQVMFALQNAPAQQLRLPGLEVRPLAVDIASSPFELSISLTEGAQGLEGTAEYSTDLFDATTIQRLCGYWQNLLQAAAENPGRSLQELPLMDEAQRHQLLQEWKGDGQTGQAPWVHERILATARRQPDAPAMVMGESHLSYGEMARRAGKMAAAMALRGVGREAVVGMLATSGLETWAALLGILQAGAAYLPLDPDLPRRRLEFMISDSDVKLVLTRQSLLGRLPEGAPAQAWLDADWGSDGQETASPNEAVFAQQLAYVIYTSGSTGRPKGVGVRQQGFAEFSRTIEKSYALGPNDRVLQFASISFDLSVQEAFPTLASGAALILRGPGMIDSPPTFLRHCREEALTDLNLPTAYWHQLVADCRDHPPPLPKSLRLMEVGGEKALSGILRDWLRLWGGKFPLINAYGPTEGTVIAAFGRLDARDCSRREVSIGRPFGVSQLYLLDRRLMPTPLGAAGELYIGGKALARGYLGRPGLTAEKFIPDPFADRPGLRLYRTGDRIAWLADGRLEFLGRIDRQVKVRGFRIELGEVEAALNSHPEVQASVVMAKRGAAGLGVLTAFAAAKAEHPDLAEALRRHLSERLPSYMVPTFLTVLDSLPLTPTGKVDRRALQDLESASAATQYEPPRAGAEELLAGIWQELLGVEPVGRQDGFFALGGHSLLATQAVSRISRAFEVELPLRAIFEAPSLAALAERIEQARRSTAGKEALPPLSRAVRGQSLPLSFAQQRLWFLDQLEGLNAAYNTPMALRLEGPLDRAVLRRTLTEIVRRHESLRTTFALEEGKPVQRIGPARPVDLPLVDLQGLPPGKRMSEAGRLTLDEALRPFSLSRDLMLRAALLRFGPRDHGLPASIHHIVSDDWSMGLFSFEVPAIYNAFAAGDPSPLPELQFQYADFALWQRRRLSGENLQRQLDFWRRRLADAPQLMLPADRPRPASQSFRAGHRSLRLDTALTRRLEETGRQSGATLFMTLAAAYLTLLHRSSGQKDLTLGYPVANRNHPETEPMIGFFANILVLRADFSADPDFQQALQRVRTVCLQAYEHQDLPFEQIVEELHPQRTLAFNPLVQATFAFQNAPKKPLDIEGIRIGPLFSHLPTVRFDLELHAWESEGGVDVDILFASDLFDRSTIQRLAGHFTALLQEVCEHPEKRLSEFAFLSPAERHQLLRGWNDTRRGYPRHSSIHRLYSLQAGQRPHAAAVCFEASPGFPWQLSYGETERRSNQLARHLLSLGAVPDMLVGLCVERTPEQAVALLGILKAGGAYLPLDPAYPVERLSLVIEDAGIALLVAQEKWMQQLPAQWAIAIALDADWAAIAQQEASPPQIPASALQLAYAVYTSGSTGRPKGTLVEHRSVLRLVQNANYVDLSERDVFLQMAPVSFDASTFEFWACLLNGGRLQVMPAETPSLQSLGDALQRHQVSVLWLTAGLFQMMAEENLQSLAGLRLLLAGGDVLPVPQVEKVLRRLPGCRLINGYGPTENTTFTCCHPMAPAPKILGTVPNGRRISGTVPIDPEGTVPNKAGTVPNQAGTVPNGRGTVPSGGRFSGTVPIGRPISNTQAYLLDGWMAPVPIGTVGELLAGGDGLARGYLNQTRLTAERFLPDPFSTRPGARLYRTGDRARLLPSGEIEFLGRSDHQVKIRGYRVELGEIEAALAALPSVQKAVAVVRHESAGDKSLTAYVVPRRSASESEYAAPPEEQGKHVSDWQALYENLYRQPTSEPDFNIIGWNSSYTGKPIPKEEMRQWVDGIVKGILACRPERVLELGCGTGLLLSRIAPRCSHYTATDFSRQALQQIRRLQQARPELNNLTLLHRAADRFEGLERESFDTVILNSVVQYFPSIDYLLQVLQGAAKLLRPGGRIFLGDLRNLALLRAYHASVQLHQAASSLTLGDFRRRVEARTIQEEELLIHPAFFSAATSSLPGIGRVEVRPQRGSFHNELTRFRYEAVLHAVPPVERALEADWLDWDGEGLSAAELRRRLEEEGPGVLAVRNVPNARLREEVEALEWIAAGGESQNIGQLRQRLSALKGRDADPEELWGWGRELPCQVEISWAAGSPQGRMDVLFQRRGGRSSALPFPQPEAALPLHEYANNPLQERVARRLAPRLREELQGKLPDYMVPSAIVVLPEFPLTPNGKIDRRALPEPVQARAEGGYAAGRTSAEQILCGIWAEVLGLERVGIHDSFFDLGGHSLLATQVISRINRAFGVEVPLRTLFEAQTVASLAQAVEELAGQPGASSLPFRTYPRREAMPLSFAQQRLWFLDQLEPGLSVYNVSAALRVRGKLRADVLQAALNEVLRRHEALRTCFPARDGRPLQRILPYRPARWPLIDLRALDDSKAQAEMRRLVDDEAKRPFDLVGGPLLRAPLIRLEEDRHVLPATMHHIVSDGWSMGVWVNELTQLYAAFSEGLASPLPELPIQYADFACRQREWLSGEVLASQLQYWKERLSGAQPLDLPTDLPRPSVLSHRGASLPLQWPADLLESLQALSRRQDVTLFMTLAAGLQAVLARWSGQDDISIGLPVANRNHAETEGLIGFFVNTLVLRTNLSGRPSFSRLVEHVREASLGAFANQDVPFEQVVESVQPERSLSRTPLFQVMLALQNVPFTELRLPGLEITSLEVPVRTSIFEFTISAAETRQGLEGSVQYSLDLFEEASMRRLLGHWQRLLKGALQDPGQNVFELPLMGSSERRQVLEQWNATERLFDKQAPLSRHLARHAKERPWAVALVHEGRDEVSAHLSYGELERRVGSAAQFLMQKGIGPESIVGLHARRSLEMLTALLAVLHAGGAYLPLDPAYPPQRLAFMVRDADVSLVLEEGGLAGRVCWEGAEAYDLCCCHQAPAGMPSAPMGGVEVPEGCLAYVIYTSGTTGRPKGVAVPRRGLWNSTEAQVEAFQLDSNSRVLQFASLNFDVSIYEITMALRVGAALHLADSERMMPGPDLSRLLRCCSITVFVPTPSTLLAMGIKDLPALRTIIVAGEACPAELPARWAPGRRFYNAYGPTEATIWASAQLCRGGPPPPIGRPIANAQIYLLDRLGNPVPAGVPGELHIGGRGVTRGYLSRPARTAQQFVPDRFGGRPGKRLYRSGDLARYRSSGEIDFLGRLDHQVKVRGFRIECGEIETALREHPAIQDAAVVAQGEGVVGRKLVAYIHPRQGSHRDTEDTESGISLQPDSLSAFLKPRLPAHMVPSLFVVVDSLPKTASGKVDRKALPRAEAPQSLRRYEPPRTPVEQGLAEIWMELLGAEKAGLRDNFFELGGHSLLATQALSRIRGRLGAELPLRMLFEAPDLESLARSVEAALPGESGNGRQPSRNLAQFIEAQQQEAFEEEGEL